MHKLQPALPCSLSIPPSLSLSLTVSGKLNGLLCRRESPYYSLWRLHSYWFDVALYFCVFSFCLNSILVHCTFCHGRKCDRADDGRCKWMRGEQGRDIEGMLGGGREGTSRQFANSCSQQSANKCYSRWADCQLATRGQPPSLPSSHSSPPSPLPLCLPLWYIFEFGNLVICNLLSFFRNLSGRCMLNATREIT